MNETYRGAVAVGKAGHFVVVVVVVFPAFQEGRKRGQE